MKAEKYTPPIYVLDMSSEESQNPQFWLSQIDDALEMLAFHAIRQRMSEGIDSTPVYEAFNKIGDAIVALQQLGHEVPLIDLSGLPEQFIYCMSHPALRGFAQSFEIKRQVADLKAQLLQKWGTVEERRRRIRLAIG